MANDSLAKAIDYLGAVEVAPGRYAFRLKTGHPQWYVGTDETLVDISRRNIAGRSIPRTTEYAKMPSWWTPEQRFAWRYVSAYSGDTGTRVTDESKPEGAALGFQWERITADLTTGEEVPA